MAETPKKQGSSQVRKAWLAVSLFALVVLVGLAILLAGRGFPAGQATQPAQISQTEQVSQIGQVDQSAPVGQSDQERTLASLHKVDGYPLYEMTYYGDYGSERLRESGSQGITMHPDRKEGVDSGWACTTFATLNLEGQPIMGRNFDWMHRAALVLSTDPPNGYASVAMVDLAYLGFDGEIPDGADLSSLLDAPYWLFDGMNEAGLAISLMAVPHAEGIGDPQKATLGSLHVVRLLLDYAGDVDEAIALLGNYNVDFSHGPPLHYLIADAAGNAAVLEFIDGEMVVIPKNGGWQVATNFVITDAKPQGADSACNRYNTVYETLEQAGGALPQGEAMALLDAVSSPDPDYPTMWSVVYNLITGDIQIVAGMKYDQVKTFQLQMMPSR